MTQENSHRQEVLQTLQRIKFSNLSIFFDNRDFLNGIDPSVIDQILFSYNESYCRFLREIYLVRKKSFHFDEFPPVNLVITRSKHIFRELYHSPDRFHLLPDWVRDYVNFLDSTYVWWVPEGEAVKVKDVNESAHEFTHALIPGMLQIPSRYLEDAWPAWIHESYTVGINQLKPIEWTIEQFRKPGAVIPTAKSIEEHGVFFHDARPPGENPIFQYSYWLTKAVGEQVREIEYSDFPDITPLHAISLLTKKAYRTGFPTFKAIIDDRKIDLSDAFFKCRQLLKIVA